ncbi:phosphoadenosine phosphosulfate reductase domain-containing protein [Photobacterium leiognathi]|uniref:phosphoadenosine phosphosulfate reductase domain-containing protein n=2 Tax=Photobacterium leiognathi TaxID=553611 RepID=UPI0029823BA7|nr:phosphoadenosine phosphosulfate reductase family protein [Photobacterium leiognathi]
MWLSNSTDPKDQILVDLINDKNIDLKIRNNAWDKLKNVQLTNSKPSFADDIRMLAEESINAMVGVLESGNGLLGAISWGKDSTACLILMLEAVKRFKRVNPDKEIPKCYAVNSNTKIENPAMDEYYIGMAANLDMFNSVNGLNVEYIEVRPEITSDWFYSVIGRGKLPIYPGMQRCCSVDLKINPIKRIKASLKRQKLVSVVGTRFSESEDRKQRMLERGDTANKVLVGKDGDMTILPIADWELDDVWALLTFCDSSSSNQLYQTFVSAFSDTIDIYRSANGGECALNMGEKGQESACGARFGCAFCLASGDKDKSLRAMIDSDPEKYSYLKGINDFRDFLFAIRWDLSRREFLGRTGDSVTGYTALQPAYFNYETRLELLRYLLTLDAIESEWAESHNEGIVRFEMVSYSQLVEVDYLWALYHDSHCSFSAINEYYEIRHCGKRYPIPHIEVAPKISIPSKRWIKLPDYEEINLSHLRNGRDGLHDPVLIERARESGQEIKVIIDAMTGKPKEIVPFDAAKTMSIISIDSALFVEQFCEVMAGGGNWTEYSIDESVYFYLNKGIIKLSGSQPNAHDRIMQRSTLWADYQKYVCIDDHQEFIDSVLSDSISDTEHSKIKAALKPVGDIAVIPVECEEEQLDLF